MFGGKGARETVDVKLLKIWLPSSWDRLSLKEREREREREKRNKKEERERETERERESCALQVNFTFLGCLSTHPQTLKLAKWISS